MRHDKLDPGAPGAHLCVCDACRRTFIGRKFDVLCAECEPAHQLPVLDALQVLQRVGSDTSEVVNAGDFLRRMGEAGLRVIADPACEVRADRQAAGAQVQQDWTPTAENVNALPEPLRRYIHDLETLCDPAGIVRENTLLKDCNRGLQVMYRKAAGAEAQQENEDMPQWRVGEFWSSANPGKRVLMVAVGAEEISEYGAHCDFIRWVSGVAAPAGEQK